MKNNFKTHVDIAGFGNSGKSIVSDYLKEFKNIYVPRKDFEFNLLRGPGGLIDMHYGLVENWTPIRADDSIKRFVKLTKRLGSRTKFRSTDEMINAAGYKYESFYPGFFYLTDKFLKEIITFTYKGLWPYADYHSPTFNFLIKRISSKIIKKYKLTKIIFSDGMNFTEKLNDYVYSIFNLAIKKKFKIYITHNAFEPYEIDRYLKIMKNSKSILVKRDPRDVYTNIVGGNKDKSGFYKKINPTFYNISAAANLQDFILYQKKILSYLNKLENPNLLVVDFKEFINNYDSVSLEINNFLGLSYIDHTNKFKYFNPNLSIKNVGVYRNFEDKKSIQLIEKELSNYWDFNTKKLI